MANTVTPSFTDLRLTRMGGETDAGLWLVSLPWPRMETRKLALGHRSTYLKPLGQWYAQNSPMPRRLLLIADGANTAPEQIRLTATGSSAPPVAETTDITMTLMERSPHPEFVWERHLLSIRRGNLSLGLAMGLRTDGEVHWWEACRLVVLENTAECLVVEMGGAIPHIIQPLEEMRSYPGLTNPYLHKHNWLNGHLHVRVHANGVCEVIARHVNSKFFDDGLPLDDVVPVVGFRLDATDAEVAGITGVWDGSRTSLKLGGVDFDLAEAARLARPAEPGAIGFDGSLIVWQPYQGVDLFGGTCGEQLLRDPFLSHAERRIFPRGMSRTLRFSFSLSDRSPRVARYAAPAWWYGLCEEFLPEPLLPVSNSYGRAFDHARHWVQEHIVRGGFEDGSVPRHTVQTWAGKGRTRYEPGWEGEMPYAQFLAAWRTGNAEDHAAAIRSAYHFTDVAVDHAAKLVRMHGYPPHAFAVPMNRMQGAIAAYLETGDPFLLETAQAVTANAYWTHKNSWPRLAVGRDACFIRSAVLLYRYFGEEFFRRIAYEAAQDAIASQRPNGSFGDQAGGTGVHQWGAYITKPWMGLMALNGVLDYLELFPNEEPFAQAVRKFADWLMSERHDQDGVLTWSYQHDFDGRREFTGVSGEGPTRLPTEGRWHMDTLARLLGYTALRFGEMSYLDAWAESQAGKAEPGGDHYVAATLQFVPWVQAHLWRARLVDNGVEIAPVHFGRRTPAEASIESPQGRLLVRWTAADTLELPATVRLASDATCKRSVAMSGPVTSA